jgi:hypothetical protein
LRAASPVSCTKLAPMQRCDGTRRTELAFDGFEAAAIDEPSKTSAADIPSDRIKVSTIDRLAAPR